MDSDAPLKASSAVRALDLMALLRIAQRTGFDTARVKRAFSFVDERFVTDEKNFPTGDDPDHTTDSAKSFPAHEIQVLIDSAVARPADEKEIKRMCRLFSVIEKAKEGKPSNARGECRRAILWPKILNDELEEVPTPKLDDSVESAREVERDTFAVCFDLKNGFHQVPLSASRARHFGLRLGKNCFVFVRMPMGVTFAPEVMQVIVELLAHAAIHDTKARGAVTARVHIDNVRFVSKSKKILDKAATAFKDLCNSATVTLNEEPENEIHQLGGFLGQRCDYLNGMVSMEERTLQKLQEKATAAFAPEASLRDIYRLYGSCQYASRILRVAPANHYAAIKFCRKRLSDFSSGDINVFLAQPARLWPCAKLDFERWIEELRPNIPINHLQKPSPDTTRITLFVDASLRGWGAVLISPSGEVKVAGDKWKQRKHLAAVAEGASGSINILEMAAVTAALQFFDSTIRVFDKSIPLALFVDSTSTFFVLKKGTAREYLLNEEAKNALEHMAGDRFVETRWISTLLNLADGPSRGEVVVPSAERLQAALPPSSVWPVGRCGVAAVRVPRAPR